MAVGSYEVLLHVKLPEIRRSGGRQSIQAGKCKPENAGSCKNYPPSLRVGYKNAVKKIKLHITLIRVTPGNKSENKYCGITFQRYTKIESQSVRRFKEIFLRVFFSMKFAMSSLKKLYTPMLESIPSQERHTISF